MQLRAMLLMMSIPPCVKFQPALFVSRTEVPAKGTLGKLFCGSFYRGYRVLDYVCLRHIWSLAAACWAPIMAMHDPAVK
jgi:hypothetical protein